jgi:acyl dehydratase
MKSGKNIIKIFKKKKITFKKKITLKDILFFSKLVNDKHKLHKDKKFSEKKNFKNIVCQGLFLSSLCSSLVFKFFGNNSIIIKQNFAYHRPTYLNETVEIFGNVYLLDKRFYIYEIKIFIKVKKIIKSEGVITIKSI